MASDWKSSLSVSDRYNAVQSIQTSRGLGIAEAIPMEQDAYNSSLSKDDYLAICYPTSPPSHINSLREEPPSEGSGILLGSYSNCHPIADGLTSEVYRSDDRALKVIVNQGANIEPHNPQREIRILESLRDQPSVIQLLSTFRDQEQRLVLVFPYMPLTLGDILTRGENLSLDQICSIFSDILLALKHIHGQGIVHRDVKPSAILLSSASGPAYLSDFGTAWHPTYSASSEPADAKILDIGTGPYRAPDVLFGNSSYGSSVDMWSLGVVLSEAIRQPPTPLFESRPAHEDGSQLGLILSIFKTLGTPTPETWPEAKSFKVTPFELWTVFPPKPWIDLLPGVDPELRELVSSLLRFDGKRATAEEVLQSSLFTGTK